MDLCKPSYSWTVHHHYSWYEHGSGAEKTDQQQQSKATHLQLVLTQQRPNCREGTPRGTPPDSQRQVVKENMSPVTHAFHTCQTHSLALTTSHHSKSSKATMSQTSRDTPNGAISCSERWPKCWGPHRRERGIGECPATPGRVHRQHTRGSFRWMTEGSLHDHQHRQGR